MRIRNYLSLAAAALVGAAVLGAPSKADAAFSIFLQEDGGAIVQVATGANFSDISFSGTFGDFGVRVFGSSSDNGAALSDLLSSTTSVTNNGGATHTLTLYASQTDYTLPVTGGLIVESGLGGSVSTPTLTLTNIFQAYADKNNNLLGMSDFTNGPQSATPNGSTFDTGSAQGLFSRIGNYSLTSQVNFQLSGGGQANFSDHINVRAVPAPAGLVLALTALPVIGLGAWRRRRAGAAPVAA